MSALKFAVLPALLALSVCQTTTAGSISTASFQATFVIRDACTIASHATGATVQCRLNSPYLLQRTSASGDAVLGSDADSGLLTVSF